MFLLMAFEDSGSKTQLVRLRAWPHTPPLVWALALVFVSLAGLAGVNGASYAAAAFAALGAILAWMSARECGVTMRAVLQAAASCGLMGGGPAGPAPVPEQESTDEAV